MEAAGALHVFLNAAWEAWPMLLTADLATVDHRHLELVQQLVSCAIYRTCMTCQGSRARRSI